MSKSSRLDSVHIDVFGRELPIERGEPQYGTACSRPHWKAIHMPEGALIPDTLEGAIMLSGIDFFLSFFVIAGIGLVLAVFPILNRLARTRDVIED